VRSLNVNTARSFAQTLRLMATSRAMVEVPRVRAVKARLNQAMGTASENSPLAHLPRAKRKMYEHLFSLIYECSANRIAAKSLVDRIVQRVTS
jgi:hypothetical protein